MLGKTVSDLQSDVAVADGKITGTLIYNEGWESGPLAGPGYFMALKFSSEDWADYDSIMVGLDPSIGTGLVEVKNDPDKNGVFKISDRGTQKFIVQTRVGSITTRTQYDLSELVYQEPVVSGMLEAPSPDAIISGVTVSDVQTNVSISAGSNPGEFTVSGNLIYDTETQAPSKYRLFLSSTDRVDFDSYELKGVLNGSEFAPGGITAFYYGAQYGAYYAFSIGFTSEGAEGVDVYDDVYLSVTLNGETEKYSIKNLIFAPAT